VSFTPFSSANDPIVHTYIDFELIPPIITNEILAMEGDKSNKIASAVSVFTLGGTMGNHTDFSKLVEDPLFWELCKSSIIYLVNELVSASQITKITDEIVIKSLEMMHNRMHENLTVNEIARECYMTPDGFIRRFSHVVGITPHTYLKNIRLRTACYLKESGMSLAQIASEVGYSDASALCHALRSK
jgi:AraC-like DNA-binding protein